MDLGLPGASTRPSSQTASETTATLFRAKRRWMAGRLDSPLASSRKCVPATWTTPCFSSVRAWVLLRCATTSSTPARSTWRASTEMPGSQPATRMRLARSYSDARIAAGHQDAVGQIVFSMKELDRGFPGLAGPGGGVNVANEDRIGGRQIPGNRRRRRCYRAPVHAAELHGVARARGIRLGQQRHLLGGERGGRRVRWEREEIFHVDFKRPRQAQRDRGVRHIAAGFDRVDGLAADAGTLSQLSRREASFLAVGSEVGGDVAVVFHARRLSL